MRWPIVRLEQLALPEAGAVKIGPFGSQLKRSELVSEGVHVVGIENVLARGFDGLGTRYVTEEKYRTLQSVEVRPGDILVTMMGTVGEAAIVPPGTHRSIMDSHLLRFRPNNNICISEYVAWLLRSPALRSQLDSRAHGAIMKGLNSGIIRSLRVPLPPLSEQRRIMEILDRADELRRLRAEADAKAERILPALFIKMFGDPATNPMGWPIALLGRVGELDRGRSQHRPRNDPILLGGPYPLIQTGEVAGSDGRIRTHSQTYSEVGLKQSKLWPSGTLCVTIAANIAKSAVLTFDACFPDSVVGFRPSPEVTTEYVQCALGLLQQNIERRAPQLAQKNINLEILRNLLIPSPPRPLQDSFSTRVDSFYDAKEKETLTRVRISTLFSTLLRNAFSGSLTAAWREAHMKELLQEMEQQALALSARTSAEALT